MYVQEWLSPQGKGALPYKTNEILINDAVTVEPKPKTEDPEENQDVHITAVTQLIFPQCPASYVGLPGQQVAPQPITTVHPAGDTSYTRLPGSVWGCSMGEVQVTPPPPPPLDVFESSCTDSGCSCDELTPSPECSLPNSPVEASSPPRYFSESRAVVSQEERRQTGVRACGGSDQEEEEEERRDPGVPACGGSHQEEEVQRRQHGVRACGGSDQEEEVQRRQPEVRACGWSHQEEEVQRWKPGVPACSGSDQEERGLPGVPACGGSVQEERRQHGVRAFGGSDQEEEVQRRELGVRACGGSDQEEEVQRRQSGVRALGGAGGATTSHLSPKRHDTAEAFPHQHAQNGAHSLEGEAAAGCFTSGIKEEPSDLEPVIKWEVWEGSVLDQQEADGAEHQRQETAALKRKETNAANSRWRKRL
ncbi:unnamed protein product [Pleuronectes platessa]|uniref:Uncharacterized protein n=1 Tax=Pleuronectes platessa TaxID=8262 RepID=A0A9N7YV64_PLEPL|nr:unnamed protein product [Pleuronectes platessa]